MSERKRILDLIKGLTDGLATKQHAVDNLERAVEAAKRDLAKQQGSVEGLQLLLAQINQADAEAAKLADAAKAAEPRPEPAALKLAEAEGK